MLKPYDPARQTHIWFVDNGATNGFIPANALTPYMKLYNNSNLINFEESNKTSTRGGAVLRKNENTETKPKAINNSSSSTNASNSLIDLMDVFENQPPAPPPHPPPPPPQQQQLCVAMFDFKAIASNMIDLVRGQKYKVIEMCDKKGDAEWWLVEWTVDGVRGYIPKNYVKII